ncbi:MAG: B12-binding domain-containing radical SAM protein [Nanoarchaeota archaeon]|nr:B12-binding domain-containing radical SAM protein [Nanoarchaeota archaeon]
MRLMLLTEMLMRKINKVGFIYLTPTSGEFQITDDLGYDIQRRPQLGFQYLCSILKKRGIETDILDQSVSFFNFDWLLEKIKEYDMIGFYCSDCQEAKVKTFCKRIKENLDIPILVGGPSTMKNPSFLDYQCDMVVHGEGEITIQEIVDYYEGRKEIEKIKGISYKKDNQIITADPQKIIENLDELPFPDRSKVDIKYYYDYLLFGMKVPYVTMIASRGCVNRCTYCTSPRIWGHRYRRRGVDNVLAEVDEVVEKYNVKYISFQDDMFGLTNDWIEDFCKKLIKRPYKLNWMVILHPFSMRKDTEKILGLMRKAGCNTLSFGLQSSHPTILKNINRHQSEPEQLERIISIANKLGFVTAVGYIFGLPGDTKETIETTIDYSLDCGSLLASYYKLSILRGSDIDLDYKDKKLTNLTDEEIMAFAVKATKKFYSRPKIILRAGYIIAKNPRWFVKVLSKGLPSILARIGFIRTKERRS